MQIQGNDTNRQQQSSRAQTLAQRDLRASVSAAPMKGSHSANSET